MRQSERLLAATVANLLVLGVFAYMAVLHERAPDFYYMSVQEDEYIEWSTYCAFALAAGAWLVAAWRDYHRGNGLPWFLITVALFCVFVAGEEISWGQRILGYRPPEYFLAHNFQQELNLHNVVSTDLRKLTLKIIIGGYGIALPLLALLPRGKRLLKRVRIAAPTSLLVPAFAATLAAYVDYPWKYTGETVELMLGLGFLFASMIHLRDHRSYGESDPGSPRSALVPIVVSWLIVMALGVANAAAARVRRSDDPARVEAARVELEALRHDFLWMSTGRNKHFSTNRTLHKRVYTYEKEHHAHHLNRGEFSALVDRGLPVERADFFLDPWNLPYWINVRASGARENRVAFVYSFGPNRRRDSTYTEIRGDDVGVYIIGQGKAGTISQPRK